MIKFVENKLTRVSILFVRVYQGTFALFLGGNCRFSPSCSEYAKESFEKFGFLKGLQLTTLRLSKCHPLGSHGYDPVEKGE